MKMRNYLKVIASLTPGPETFGLELEQFKFEKCVYSVRVLLHCRFISKNVKVKTHKAVLLLSFTRVWV
jgi:hypothetical protein